MQPRIGAMDRPYLPSFSLARNPSLPKGSVSLPRDSCCFCTCPRGRTTYIASTPRASRSMCFFGAQINSDCVNLRMAHWSIVAWVEHAKRYDKFPALLLVCQVQTLTVGFVGMSAVFHASSRVPLMFGAVSCWLKRACCCQLHI